MVVKSKLVPGVASLFSGMDIAAVTIAFWVFVKPEYADQKVLLNHESIHVEQYKETLVIGFLLIYLFDFIIKFIRYGNWADAYMNLAFEREAYSNESNLDYIPERKRYNWIKLMGH